MNWMLSVIVGTTAVIYVNSFNHIMKLYKESGYTLTWRELLDKNLTIAGL